MSVERMLVVIDAQTELLRREMRRADKATGQFERNSSRHLKKLDQNFDRFQKRQAKRMKQMAAMYAGFMVTRGIAGGFSSVVNSSANLQTSLNQLEAVSGATGKKLAMLRKEALRLGSSTQYTAGQVGGGMNELARAGMKFDKILLSTASTLTLATAAKMDMAQASDIVTNVVAGMGHEMGRLEKDIDTIIATVTSSNTVVVEFGDAIKYAGATASNNGFVFEELAATIGMLANAGIKGEMAGTSIRGAIVKMINPSNEAKRAMAELGIGFTDNTGQLRKFTDILQDLQPHFKNTQFFAKVFGQRAMNAMQILARQGGDVLDDYTKKLDTMGGVAKKIADVQMKGLHGSVKELTSATEGLSIEMDDRTGLTAWLEKMARSAAKAARQLTALSKARRGVGNIQQLDIAISSKQNQIHQYKNGGFWNSLRSIHKLSGGDLLPKMEAELTNLRNKRSMLINDNLLKLRDMDEKALNAYLTQQNQLVGKAKEKLTSALSTPGFWKSKTTKNPIFNDLKDIDRQVAAMQSARDMYGQTAGEIARVNVSRDIYNRLQDRGITLTDAETQGLDRNLNRLRDKVNANAEYARAMENLQAVSDVVASGMEDSFAKFTQTGKLDFESMISSMLANLAKLVFQMNVIQPLFGGGSSTGGGLFGSMLGSLTGIPGRASGGPVSAGQIYQVNEGRQTEMFVPNVNGMILSASSTQKALSGGGAISIAIGDIIVEGAGGSPEEVAQIVLAQVPAVTVQAVAQARAEGKL